MFMYHGQLLPSVKYCEQATDLLLFDLLSQIV